jgi:hypothetical protein
MTQPATNFGPIVGSWEMVEAWDMDDPGKPGKSYPWGNPPLGFWVYDASGNVSVQISINPPLPVPWQSWWQLGGDLPTNLMLESFNNYMAYWGTYEVDYNGGTVTHHVVTDVLRQYTGTSQARDFKLGNDNNELVISGESYLRRFKRVA